MKPFAPKDLFLHQKVTDVHGGRAGYALLDCDSNVYRQALCSHGWAVLLLDTVGSGSFGREFCERLAGQWGELDLPQRLAAIAQLRDESLRDDRKRALYPGEEHRFLGEGKPSSRTDAARRIMDWVIRHSGRVPQRTAHGDRGVEAEHYESSPG